MNTEYTEDVVASLYDELYRLEDAFDEVNPLCPDYEGIVDHLRGLVEWTKDELRLAGEQV